MRKVSYWYYLETALVTIFFPVCFLLAILFDICDEISYYFEEKKKERKEGGKNE